MRGKGKSGFEASMEVSIGPCLQVMSGQISPGPPGPAEITGVTMAIFVIFGFF